MDEMLMHPFGATNEILELFERMKQQIEHDQQFMDLQEERSSESFGFSHEHQQEGSNPFLMVPSRPDARQQRAAAPDSKLTWEQAAEQLRQLGALVHLPDDAEQKELDWSDMAGYEVQKRTVEDLVLMSVKHADEYERVAKQTRKDGKHQRPKVLDSPLLEDKFGGKCRAF